MKKAECVFVAPKGWAGFEKERQAVERAWKELCQWLDNRSRGLFQAVADVSGYQHEENLDSENVAQFCERLHREMGAAYRVFLVRGVGGYAGALWYGAAILGDACIDELAEVARPTACDELVHGDRWTCSRKGQIGAMLHELGHLYGLEHEDEGFMAHYKTWPNVEVPTRAKEKMFLMEELVGPRRGQWWSTLVELLLQPIRWLRLAQKR